MLEHKASRHAMYDRGTYSARNATMPLTVLCEQCHDAVDHAAFAMMYIRALTVPKDTSFPRYITDQYPLRPPLISPIQLPPTRYRSQCNRTTTPGLNGCSPSSPSSPSPPQTSRPPCPPLPPNNHASPTQPAAPSQAPPPSTQPSPPSLPPGPATSPAQPST